MKLEFSLDSPCLTCSGVKLPVCRVCRVCPECHKPTGCEPVRVADPRERSPWGVYPDVD